MQAVSEIEDLQVAQVPQFIKVTQVAKDEMADIAE
jgi:hypothetical protein